MTTNNSETEQQNLQIRDLTHARTGARARMQTQTAHTHTHTHKSVS